MAIQALAVLLGAVVWQMLHALVTLVMKDQGAVGVKTCSTLHTLVVVQGMVRSLLHPEQALAADPMFGSSGMTTFYFCIAASYYLWAALSCGHAAVQPAGTDEAAPATPCYSMVLLHHCTCFISYYASAGLPFMQYPAQFFLLSEISTIFLNGRWFAAKQIMLTPPVNQDEQSSETWRWKHRICYIEWAFIASFVLTRFVIGGTASLVWFGRCAQILVAPQTRLTFRVASAFFLAANLTWNTLNMFWLYRAILWQNHKTATLPSSPAAAAVAQQQQQQQHAGKAAGAVDSLEYSVQLRIGEDAGNWQCACIARFRSALDCDWNIFVSRATSPRQAGKDAAAYNTRTLVTGVDAAADGSARTRAGTSAPAPLEKVAGNGVTFLTRIHGVVYDLRKFSHPGGPLALSLCLGRDGTALFEAHHPFSNPAAVLGKYKWRGVGEPPALTDDGHGPSPYRWPLAVDPFEVEVKAAVRAYFEGEAARRMVTLQQAMKATPRRWAEICCMALAFGLSAAATVQGKWWSLLTTPLCAWVWLANMFHDGCHFALSTRWQVNAALPYLTPWLSSPLTWYHQHVIGHHAYPNVDHRDPDLAHAPQLMREHISVRWRPTHRTQSTVVRVLLVWSIAVSFGLQLLSDLRLLLRGTYNNVVPADPNLTKARVAAHVLGRLSYLFTAFIWPWLVFDSRAKALVFSVVPPIVFSLLFMGSSQVNHLTEHTAHAQSSSYYRHQVLTAQDFSVKPTADQAAAAAAGGAWSWAGGVWDGGLRLAMFYLTGGLNHQIEHHLFPTVCHCHLPHLQPIVEAICLKHGVRYQAAESWWAALADHLRHTEAMAVDPKAA